MIVGIISLYLLEVHNELREACPLSCYLSHQVWLLVWYINHYSVSREESLICPRLSTGRWGAMGSRLQQHRREWHRRAHPKGSLIGHHHKRFWFLENRFARKKIFEGFVLTIERVHQCVQSLQHRSFCPRSLRARKMPRIGSHYPSPHQGPLLPVVVYLGPIPNQNEWQAKSTY